MSAVITRAKQQYIKAIKWEIGVILLGVCFVSLIQFSASMSFLVGAFSAFLPHCVFVYWVFFRAAKNQQKITAFYRGEGIKWLVAIILIALSFIFIPHLKLLFFFIGYILVLGLNIVLPIALNRQAV